MKTPLHRNKVALCLMTLAVSFFCASRALAQVDIYADLWAGGATGWAPPDPNAAVGPNYVLEFVNDSLEIFDKQGNFISSKTGGNFFGFTTGGDGHVIYNEITGRFAAEELSTNGVVFAVSDTSDPRGTWHSIYIGVPGIWDGYGGNGIGYNADAYVVHVNGFNNYFAVVPAKNNANLTNALYQAPSGYRIGRPVPMPGSKSGDPFYFLEGNDDGVNGTGGTAGYLELVKISNILKGPTFADYQIYVGGSDASVINTSFRGNQLAAIGKNGSQVEWYLVNPANASVIQTGTFGTPDGGSVDDPSIAISPNGSIGVNYLSVGSSSTAMYVAGRVPSDASGTMRSSVQAGNGFNSNGRLGDYSSCAVDVNATGNAVDDFWACNELMNSSSEFDWKTVLTEFAPANTSLVAYWTFDEGSGATAGDSSIYNNTGTLAGPTWVTPGKVGAAALSFNASSRQGVNVSDSSSLDSPRGSITIAAWVKPTDWNGNRRILEKGNGDNQYGLLNNGGQLEFLLFGVGALLTSLPATGTWTYVTATWDGNTMRIYYNGISVASQWASGTISTTSDTLQIGGKYGSSTSGDYFNGRIDDVRIYNTALIASDVNTIMSKGTLVAYWKFDEGSGYCASDSSINDNNTGELGDGAGWTSGRVGSAVSLNANNNQAVNVNSSTSLNSPTSNITIAAWIYANDWNGNRRILEKGNGDNQYGLLANGGQLEFLLSGVGTLFASLPATGQWVHVAATWDGSTMRIYYNGVLVASQAGHGTISTTGDPLQIGGKYGSSTSGDYFNGSLDEVHIYNRALVGPEINTIMNYY